ncbi:MAG: hypothetical protein ACI8XU_002092, partial [Kiritimatiellia bacterium]
GGIDMAYSIQVRENSGLIETPRNTSEFTQLHG